jgi:ribosome-associated protein
MAKATRTAAKKAVTKTAFTKPKTVRAKKPTIAAVAAKVPVAKKPTRTTVGATKPRSKRPEKSPPSQFEQIEANARKAAQYAIEKKATTVHLLNLSKITSMTDFFVIASGDSDKQVKAIAENVIAEMRDTEGISPWHSEGWDNSQWVIIDFVDFVVHVFQAEARVFYNLERLWADAVIEEIKDEPKKVAKPRKKAVPKATAKSPEKTKEPMIRVIRSDS